MRAQLLRFLRIAERPEAPPGTIKSLRVFRASERFLAYLMVQWGLRQAGALFGIVVSLGFLGAFRFFDFGLERVAEEVDLADVGVTLFGFRISMPLFDLLGLIEIFAIGAFLVQLVISGLLLKLGWEMRWYMVSDASIRIREGLVRMREQTMTIANIQNMSVRQGPVQRLFGISDLEVHTAGGAGGQLDPQQGTKRENLHVGRFRGLRDAEELRNHLRAVLARHRDAGLGDEHDHELPLGAETSIAAQAQKPVQVPAADLDAVVAALLEESRKLRRVVESGGLAAR